MPATSVAGTGKEQVVSHLETAEALVDEYVDVVTRHAPVEATRLGIRASDGELPDLRPEALDARTRDLARVAAQVAVQQASLPDAQTGPELHAHGDLQLLASEIAYRRFLLEQRPRYRLDPTAVLETVSAGLHELLRRRDDDPMDVRRSMTSAVRRARRVPEMLEQAGSLLESVPAPHLRSALQQLPELIELVRDELPRRVAESTGAVTEARDAGEVAAEGLEAYGALLSELGEEPAADWRLGPDAFAFVLRHGIGAQLSAHDIHARAIVWRDTVRDELAEVTARGWSRRFAGEPMPDDETERIRRTLSAIADTAVAPADFVPEACRAVDEARVFSETVGLIDVPPASALRIERVPPYLRNIAVAFFAPPPPLDPRAAATYYVPEVQPDWDDVQVRTFLREYNPAQLRSLAIHEGYPGHFVQLEHAARHPRLARRLLARAVFAEGWAVYIERQVVDAGFGADGSSAVDADDYRITQRKLELRIATNAMLDVGLHAGDLDDPAARELLVSGAFQAPSEADGKLERAKLSSGQLSSYFVGGEELADLRWRYLQRAGPNADLRDFHQRLLSHGTPTVAIAAAELAAAPDYSRPFATSA
ncbi:MAG: DUF885 domain-containing protein [Nitriliruptoraceae bacterium]